MFLDKQQMFSEAQAITATAISDNVIDLVKANANLGVGEELYVAITVDASFTDSGSDSTLTITLETDDNAALTSATVLWTSTAIVGATGLLISQAPIYFRIPISGVWEQYLGLRYTVANGNFSTGKLTAGIVKDVQLSRAYPSGFTSA